MKLMNEQMKKRIYAKVKDWGGGVSKAISDTKYHLSNAKAPSEKRLGKFPVRYFK